MALSITLDQTAGPLRQGMHGGVGILTGSIAFDSSYPTGGEDLNLEAYLDSVYHCSLEGEDGYRFEYDKTNDKIKVFQTNGSQIPMLVVEEAVVCATNVGTLTYKPLMICAVQVTATTTTGAYNVIPVGETPLTKQVAVDFTTGGLTFLGTDAVTAALVTYIPQQPSGPLSKATLVVDEEVTASASKVELANRACAVQYVWDDTDGVLAALEPVGEAPSATHTAVIDITNATPSTDIDSHADDAGNTLKVTYLKYSAFPTDCCINDTDVSLSSEAYDATAVGGYHSTFVPGLGTQLVGEEGDTSNAVATLEGPSGTAANVVATWFPAKNYLLTNNTAAMVTTAIPWIVLDPAQLLTGGEVANTTDLSGLTAVRFFAIGRILG